MDFFLADQLTSLVRVSFDLTYGMCFYTSTAFLHGDGLFLITHPSLELTADTTVYRFVLDDCRSCLRWLLL
jgi:hypothetical protein